MEVRVITYDLLAEGEGRLSQWQERLWRLPGMIVWVASLPLRSIRFRSFATTKLIRACDRYCVPLPLPTDRYDGKFVFAMGSVLAFTLLAYWSLTDYWDVHWYAGEDGVSE